MSDMKVIGHVSFFEHERYIATDEIKLFYGHLTDDGEFVAFQGTEEGYISSPMGAMGLFGLMVSEVFKEYIDSLKPLVKERLKIISNGKQ